MTLEQEHILVGFLAHLIGGIIGGLTGWFLHAIYSRWQRGKQHAHFDREIEQFATHLKSLISKEQMPDVMARVVPLASKAIFGTEIPPLKKVYALPAGSKLGCKMCERSIEPTFDGRCPSCKIGCSLYHEPASKNS